MNQENKAENIFAYENDLFYQEQSFTNENEQEKPLSFSQQIKNDTNIKDNLHPKEQIDYIEETLEKINTNPKLKAVFDNFKELEENDEKIQKLKEDINNTKKEEYEKAEREKEKQLKEEQDKLFNDKEETLLEKQEKELAKLKENKEQIQAQLDKSINNICNINDISDFFSIIKDFENALFMSLNQSKEEAKIHKKQLAEKLDFALEHPDRQGKVLNSLIEKMYKNEKDMQKGLEHFKSARDDFMQIRDFMKKTDNGKDITTKEELKKFDELYNKCAENKFFQAKYPKTIEKSKNIYKEANQRIQENAQTQSQNQGRTN